MASIANDPNGRRRILFIGADGQRRPIRLGKMSRRKAEAIKVKVEDLVASGIAGHAPDDETSRWLAGLDDQLRDKLARVGLLASRPKTTLGAFIDGYTGQRVDVKASTKLVYRRVRKHLVEYFGPDKPLRDITPGDADAWRLHLIEKGLADNTVRRSCTMAKQYFTAAVRQRLISENPFADLSAGVKANASRLYFVRREEAQRVLDACPDAEWRLLFALGRYGGLRVPSEALGLRWCDIDWERERFTVASPKTEHIEGHESRVVPIFPELLPCLRDAFEEAEEGAEYVITRYRDLATNLRTQLLRIIKRAGLEAWPKAWQNLRATRETELADDFPAHVVSAWIGNSVPVAAKHYLQVTEDHFRRAAQNPAQQLHETARNDPQRERRCEDALAAKSSGYDSLHEKTAPCEMQEAVTPWAARDSNPGPAD
jgi:integrase